MLTELLCFVLLVVAGLSVFVIYAIVSKDFRRAHVVLSPAETVAVCLPAVAAYLFLLRTMEWRGFPFWRFELLLLICNVVAILTSATWSPWLVLTWRKLQVTKEDRPEVGPQVLVLLTAISACFLLFEAAGLIVMMRDAAFEGWSALPKSEQYFYYGMMVVVVIVAVVVLIGTTVGSQPGWLGTTKVIVSLLTCLWALFWGMAVVYAFLEKLGAST